MASEITTPLTASGGVEPLADERGGEAGTPRRRVKINSKTARPFGEGPDLVIKVQSIAFSRFTPSTSELHWAAEVAEGGQFTFQLNEKRADPLGGPTL